MRKLVELEKINKNYLKKQVLRDISLSIEEKQITALLGGNGTGKSTLLRVIAGIEQPSSGRIVYSDKHSRIGYVPERFPKHLRFTPREYLHYMGKISGIPKENLHERIEYYLHRFQLEELNNHRIMELSKGNIQKVGIIQAILNKPDLLILDEPLSGLDYQAQQGLVEVLVELRDEGSSIVLSYHESNIFESAIDRTYYLHNGLISKTDSSKQSIKLIGVGHMDNANMLEWDGVLHVEEKGNERYLHVSAEKCDEILLRILHLQGSIRTVSALNVKEERRNN